VILDFLMGMDLTLDDVGVNPVEKVEIPGDGRRILSGHMLHVHVGRMGSKRLVDLGRRERGDHPATLICPRFRIGS